MKTDVADSGKDLVCPLKELIRMIFALNIENVPVISSTTFLGANQEVQSTKKATRKQGQTQLNGLSCNRPSLPSEESIGDNIPGFTLSCPLPTFPTKSPPQNRGTAPLYWPMNAGKIKLLVRPSRTSVCPNLDQLYLASIPPTQKCRSRAILISV